MNVDSLMAADHIELWTMIQVFDQTFCPLADFEWHERLPVLTLWQFG
jgi:hypothetical protein